MRTVRSITEKKYIVFFSLMSVTFFFVLLYLSAGIWYENNDDIFIIEMLTGKLTGKAEYHCSFVGTLITFPISFLYRVFHTIPWWGLLILGMLVASFWINLYYCMRTARGKAELIFCTLVEVSLFIAGLHNFGQAQFSSAAILLAFSGYSALIFGHKRRSAWVVFFLCEFVACSVRDTSMILVQPIGAMTLAGVLFMDNENKTRFKDLIGRLLRCVLIAVSILAVTILINRTTFHAKEWKDWLKYNEARVYMTDYEPDIEYEELADILEKYGISEEEYTQILHYRTWYGNNHFTSECLDELLPRLKSIRSRRLDADRLIEATKQLLFTSIEFWHLHQLTAVFFLVLIVISIVAGRYKTLIPILAMFCAYFVGVVYLAYRDRYVLRVMMPYYQGTLLLLSGFLISVLGGFRKEQVRDRVALIAAVFLLLGVSAFSLQIGRLQFSYIRAQNHHVNATFYAENSEMMEYCKERPEKHFVLDMSYSSYTSTDIFEHKFFGRANHIYSSSWYSNTPEVYKYCQNYIADGCYYLVREAQEFGGIEGVEYYSHMFGTEPVLDDKFKLSSGATMWVWKIAP